MFIAGLFLPGGLKNALNDSTGMPRMAPTGVNIRFSGFAASLTQSYG
jgi:hypothetical protein